jgi:hypothetical protein
MGGKGQLQPELTEHFAPDEDAYLTEKVDGTNVRVLIAPDTSYAIGSREKILTVEGDLISIPDLGIVRALTNPDFTPDSPVSIISKLQKLARPNTLIVIYGELHGGNIGSAARNYTDAKNKFAFRAFDIILFTLEGLDMVCSQHRAQISTWREAGGQSFFSTDGLQAVCDAADIPLTPRIPLTSPLPEDILETSAWLEEHLPKSLIGTKRAEGIVLRSFTREKIVKLRFDDYRRTARLLNPTPKAKPVHPSEYTTWIGGLVTAPKPFKSGNHHNTVRSLTTNPHTGKPAFTFVEDDSVVDCHCCAIFSLDPQGM